MDQSDVTISSLTSEPDDLTLVHAQSGLPTTHKTRRTQEGFLIDQKRHPGCTPLPASKHPATSWVWDQGIALGSPDKNGEIQRHWLCKICYFGGVHHPKSYYLIKAGDTTTKVITHLEKHGFNRKGEHQPLDASKKRKATHSLDAAWGRQVQAHNTTIDLVA
jgi:hypothetical protein